MTPTTVLPPYSIYWKFQMSCSIDPENLVQISQNNKAFQTGRLINFPYRYVSHLLPISVGYCLTQADTDIDCSHPNCSW